MWDNIGRKLQKLAKILCWIGISISAILGLYIISRGQFIIGIVRIVTGGLLSWIASWIIYGLGIVVEYVEDTNIGRYRNSSAAPSVSSNNDVHDSGDNR